MVAIACVHMPSAPWIILREVKPPHVYKVGDWVRVTSDYPDNSEAIVETPYQIAEVRKSDVRLKNMIKPYVSFRHLETMRPTRSQVSSVCFCGRV